jgi:phosphoribosylanthranilate isomerase
VTWVKVCGLTRAEDIEVAVAAGADAIGLVLIAESPRAVTVDSAAELASGVSAETFLLTKDLGPEDIVAAALATGVDGVQPYGLNADEAARAATEAGLLLLRPVLNGDLASIPENQLLLFDGAGPGGLGGTGMVLDEIRIPVTDRRFVLAGGLGPETVARVIRKVRPYGVDASSKLEIRPGIKDHARVELFVQAAKQA